MELMQNALAIIDNDNILSIPFRVRWAKNFMTLDDQERGCERSIGLYVIADQTFFEQSAILMYMSMLSV